MGQLPKNNTEKEDLGKAFHRNGKSPKLIQGGYREESPNFLVLFFSGSHSLILKSSSKNQQMAAFFVQNDEILTT